jgi:hypothetical protein
MRPTRIRLYRRQFKLCEVQAIFTSLILTSWRSWSDWEGGVRSGSRIVRGCAEDLAKPYEGRRVRLALSDHIIAVPALAGEVSRGLRGKGERAVNAAACMWRKSLWGEILDEPFHRRDRRKGRAPIACCTCPDRFTGMDQISKALCQFY